MPYRYLKTLRQTLLVRYDRYYSRLGIRSSFGVRFFSTKKSDVLDMMMENKRLAEQLASQKGQIKMFKRHVETLTKLANCELQKIMLENKVKTLEREYLYLKNNFNLRGALELSLENYKEQENFQESAKTNEILQTLISKDSAYEACLQTVLDRYQLRKQDVNACSRSVYHELSKHAHGNTSNLKLVLNASDHVRTEVAAIETIFSALKAKNCFHLPLTICVDNDEHDL